MCTINRRLRKEQAHTIWLDNFSKIRVLKIPDINVGAWQDCNWTGRAVRLSLTPVSMDFMYENGEVIPAMPDDVFAMSTKLKSLFLSINKETTLCPHLRDASVLAVAEVNNVPSRPDKSRLVDPKHKTALIERHDSIRNCLAEGIYPINIGSNKGLMQLLRNHYTSEKQDTDGECAKYTSLNVDCDIFDRILKVVA